MGNTAFLLGIKISVILLYLWEDIPSLKSSTAPPTWRHWPRQSWPLVAQLQLLCIPHNSLPSLPGSWNRAGMDGTAHGERLQTGKGTGACIIMQSALQDLSLYFYDSIQMAADITSSFCRRDINQVWFYFTVYQTCLGQHLIPDRNGHLRSLLLKISECNAVTIAYKQKGIRSSLEEEGMMLTEKKEKLMMAQGKRCFSDIILILRYCYLMDYLHKQKTKKKKGKKIQQVPRYRHGHPASFSKWF